MKVVFVSNYFNHHQKPFSDAMWALIGDGYRFIETEPISEERLNMGWGGDEKPAYVQQNYVDTDSRVRCQQLIDDADVVMFGSAPYSLLEKRLAAGKLTVKYSERLYKEGWQLHKWPWRFYLHSRKYRRYKNFYILCASAYTSADFAKTGTFLNKAYKWGYFTEVKRYDDIESVIKAKEPASLLWVARLIGLKHPEHAIEIAKRLKDDGYTFTLNMIGCGEKEEQILEMIQRNGLLDQVKLLGSMKPEEVRRYMEKSEVFLFTSDRNEGWGAVLNESMNSACAVVASHAIGSVPFLLKDGENGRIYKDGDMEDLYQQVKTLLDNPVERSRLARNAYATMIEEWSPENAAKKLLHLFGELLAGKKHPFPYADGVCSKAKILKDDWKK